MALKAMFRKLRGRYHRAHPENRRYPRVPLKCKVTSLHSGIFQYYISTNISEGGMFLVTREPKSEGAELELEFTLPPDEDKIKVSGKVVRVLMGNETPGRNQEFFSGMGIQFQALDPATLEKIRAFVRADTDNH